MAKGKTDRIVELPLPTDDGNPVTAHEDGGLPVLLPPVRDHAANDKFDSIRATTKQNALLKSSCGNCKYRIGGNCHRNPPTVNLVAPYVDAKRAQLKDVTEYLKGEWPYVEPDGWCGEWAGAEVTTPPNSVRL